MIQKISKLILYLFLFLFAIELGLRFIDPPSLSYYRSIKLLHRFHPDYYVTLASNFDIYIKHYSGLWEGRFTTNSFGFRGSDEPNPKSKKIACLGDSLVMGFGVGDEDTFCKLLDGVNINGTKYQTQNLAVDAYGSLGSAKRLDESLKKITFDKVLFFVSPNDFTVPPGLVEQGVQADDIVEKARENDENFRRNFKIQFELTRYSYLIQATKLSIEQLSIKRHLANLELKNEIKSAEKPLNYIKSSFYTFPSPKNCNITDKKPICPESLPSNIKCDKTIPKPIDLDPLPPETIYAYNKMIKSSQQYNFQLIVVYIPMQNEDIYCNQYNMHSPLYNYVIRSKEFFKKNGIATIELLDDSKNICPLKDYYIPGDGHLTKKGNRWTLESLVPKLEELKK
jgi:hypothetical protein